MKEPSQYTSEYLRIKNEAILSAQLIQEMSYFFNWNSLSQNLKTIDRDKILSDYQELHANDKILKEDEIQLKIINLYKADGAFCKFLNESSINDIILDKLRMIFGGHICLSVNILQYDYCINYLSNIIAKIFKQEDRNSVQREFEILVNVIRNNRKIRNFKGLDYSKFLIERKTIEYLGLSNLGIIVSLNSSNCPYVMNSNDRDDIILTFKLHKKKLKILEIISTSSSSGLRYPISTIGLFVEE